MKLVPICPKSSFSYHLAHVSIAKVMLGLRYHKSVLYLSESTLTSCCSLSQLPGLFIIHIICLPHSLYLQFHSHYPLSLFLSLYIPYAFPPSLLPCSLSLVILISPLLSPAFPCPCPCPCPCPVMFLLCFSLSLLWTLTDTSEYFLSLIYSKNLYPNEAVVSVASLLCSFAYIWCRNPGGRQMDLFPRGLAFLNGTRLLI